MSRVYMEFTVIVHVNVYEDSIDVDENETKVLGKRECPEINDYVELENPKKLFESIHDKGMELLNQGHYKDMFDELTTYEVGEAKCIVQRDLSYLYGYEEDGEVYIY